MAEKNQELGSQGLGLVSPTKRFSHGAVKVGDKGQHFGFEIGHRDKGAAFEQLTRQNVEPKLDLIYPRSVFGV